MVQFFSGAGVGIVGAVVLVRARGSLYGAGKHSAVVRQQC